VSGVVLWVNPHVRMAVPAGVGLSALALIAAAVLLEAPAAEASPSVTVTSYAISGAPKPTAIAIVQTGSNEGRVWAAADALSGDPNSALFTSSGEQSSEFSQIGNIQQFSFPNAVTVDSSGRALVPSASNYFDLHIVSPSGSTTEIRTANRNRSIALGESDNIVYLLEQNGKIERLDVDSGSGAENTSDLPGAWDIAFSPIDGGMIAVSQQSEDKVSVFDTNLDLTASHDVGADPRGVAFDSDGNLYTANFGDRSVTRISNTGTVTEFAGLPGTRPYDIVQGADDALYVADRFGGVSRIALDGTVQVNWGSQPLDGTTLSGIAASPDGSIWVANEGADRVQRFAVVTTPAAPTGLSATALGQGASITFTPGSDRGSAITDYEYQLDGGDWESAGTTSSPVVIGGLTNGTTYSVKIRGVNDNGDGDASAAVDVTPVSSSDPPGVPASLEVLPGGATLDLSWEAPNPGGAPISDYEYKTDSDPWLSLGTTNSTATITTDSAGANLDPATAYGVQVRALNANGEGEASSSVTQTPGVPLAPQDPSSTWSEDSLSLSWSAATANGDPVTEYQIVVSQLSQRSGFRMLRSGPGTYTTTSTSFTLTDLNPVPTYTITLSARNGRGLGVPTSFTVAGTGQVEENSQTPPSIIQQVGLPPTGTCEDVIDGMFGTQTFIPGGWGQSWARWMNSGLGGAVCTRMLVYSNAQGRWVLTDA